jgi:flagellar hook-associated protein 2
MSSIDGLVSGMQTSTIIAQMMQLERQPVTRLELKKSAADKAITALQGLNTKFLAIAELAKKLSAAAGFSPMQATISKPEAVGVSVAQGTAPTSLSFKISSVVATHQIYSATTYAAPTEQVASVGRTITIGYTAADGTAATLDVANHDGTLQSIADAINGTAGSPITARIVKTSDAGDYRLEFTSKTAGANGDFTVTGIRNPPTPEMAFNIATQGTDAEILLGSSGTPLSITSASNTLTDVVAGVTLTLKQADVNTTITVDVARDTATVSGEVEKLITAANEFLKEAKTLTAYDTVSKKAGILQGNPIVRQLSNDLLQAVASAVGGSSAATAGIELNRDGTLKFDKAKFETAYNADPSAVAAIFYGPVGSEGIAQRLAALSEAATKSTTGLLTQAIESRRNEIKRIDDNLAIWDVRLDRREAALRRQFAALEAALGSAQTQGNWLASQIAQLPTPQ